MKNHIAIAISVETPFQAKFSFVIYGPKRCRSIKLQDCLKYIMNEMWDKRLLQVHTTPFDRRGETCTDSQPKCKITRRAISHKGFDESP